MLKLKKEDYRCIDRGGPKCPCHLIATGQCYTCKREEGLCHCNTSWPGACPYMEYIQNGMRAKDLKPAIESKIENIDCFKEDIKVFSFSVPEGLAERAKEAGAYIIASVEIDKREFLVPLSVMRSIVHGEDSIIIVAVQRTGVKTSELLKKEVGESVLIYGPYYGGVVGYDKSLDFTAFFARGIGLAPLINILDIHEAFRERKPYVKDIYVDTSKIGAEFVDTYLPPGYSWQKIDFQGDWDLVKNLVLRSKNTIFFASPYYQGLMEKEFIKPEFMKSKASDRRLVTPSDRRLVAPSDRRMVTLNHSNICCGLGLCGSCAHVDENGTVVRRCKAWKGK